MVDLSTKIGNLLLKNPIILASGTYPANLLEKDAGAYVTKSLTLSPCEGAPPPRIMEVKGGLINAVGLQNPGIDEFLKSELPSLKKVGIPIIASIAAESVKDYCALADSLGGRVDALEINVSCPNKEGVFFFGQDAHNMEKLLKAVRKVTPLPLIMKLSPLFASSVARVCEKMGADALCVGNTLPAMAVSVEEGNSFFGGLSGPAIKHVALRMMHDVVEKVQIPVIGCGGIMGWEDALEFLMVGASAVQIGTLNIIDPFAYKDVIKGLKEYMERRGLKELSQIIGVIKGDRACNRT